jgi:hypothetical protein
VIDVEGPIGQHFRYRLAMPVCDTRGLHLVVAWANKQVDLYLNGSLADTVTVEKTYPERPSVKDDA